MKYNINDIIAQHKGKRITILGNAPSVVDQSKSVAEVTDISHIDNPIWTINGAWLYCKHSSLGWDMHDIKGQDHKASREVDLDMLLYDKHDTPVMSIASYPEFPNLVEFPLEKIIKHFNIAYYGEAVHYMIAFAIYCGVKEIEFIGVDYQNGDRLIHERCGSEFWCGMAHAHGISFIMSEHTWLMTVDFESTESHRLYQPGLYGYHKGKLPFNIDRLEKEQFGEKNEEINKQNKRAKEINRIREERQSCRAS